MVGKFYKYKIGATSMSLERELVFNSMDEGLPEQVVLDRVEGMRELGEEMDSRIVQVALNQYGAPRILKTRKSKKRKFKEKISALIEEKKREIEDNYKNLLSVKVNRIILFATTFASWKCDGCNKHTRRDVYINIKCLENKGIPHVQKENRHIFDYCKKCGIIEEYNSKDDSWKELKE